MHFSSAASGSTTVKIEHAHILRFAKDYVNLAKDEVDDQRAQVNRLRGLIEDRIKADPNYGLVKCLHAGSVAKGTALSKVSDRDLAVYVKSSEAPDDGAKLVDWLLVKVKDAYPRLAEDQIVPNRRCVTVTFKGTGLTVDVVPVLYGGEPNDVGYLVDKVTGERVKTSVRLHLDFIRGRKKKYPTHLANLIRLTKWWARQIKRKDGTFKCKSFMLELLWIHLAERGVPLHDYCAALEAFFGHIYQDRFREQIGFSDFDSAFPERGLDPIQILDPVNLDNNIAENYSAADRDRLVAVAETAFNDITTARFSPTKEDAVECWRSVLGISFRGDL